jgi:asparagine synthase (glutamine-hydrolysing)
MCGIAGYVARHGRADEAVVQGQLDVLTHRGPDSSGVLVSGRAAIGQNRLAVIDLTTGDPPITTEDGRVGVVLNGEIYNYRKIRDRLQRDGHRLSTHGDTEVIAHLTEDLPVEDVARELHGMFAFATWDADHERLVLGRDRLGKKPLYYWYGPAGLVFGSEIKALLAHPAVAAELDPAAIPAYLTFGYVPSPFTFYRGILSVPPGHVLVLEGASPPRLHPYWEARVPGQEGVTRLKMSMADAAAEVRRRLATAVVDRLVADVPLGAFLSGGIDSSAVVGLMAEATSTPVRTFTIGFDDKDGFDERSWARLVADRFSTEHTEFVVKPQAVDLVERMVWHHDQPFGDSSALPTYLLSELTKGYVTVALCGDGGDEIFGGYERFAGGVAANLLTRGGGRSQRTIRRLAERLPPAALGGRVAKGQRFLRSADRGLPEAFRTWISYVPDAQLEGLVPGRHWGIDDYHEHWLKSRGASVTDRLLLLNIETYLLDDLLPKVDRMAMAHGLEVRTPFLDHELVEFALRLPPTLKLRGTSLKRVLKRSMRGFLPDEVLDRPKHGFGIPLDRWFRDDLDQYLRATLDRPDARIHEHVEQSGVQAILAGHRAGASHGNALWTLLTLEVFLRSQGW